MLYPFLSLYTDIYPSIVCTVRTWGPTFGSVQTPRVGCWPALQRHRTIMGASMPPQMSLQTLRLSIPAIFNAPNVIVKLKPRCQCVLSSLYLRCSDTQHLQYKISGYAVRQEFTFRNYNPLLAIFLSWSGFGQDYAGDIVRRTLQEQFRRVPSRVRHYLNMLYIQRHTLSISCVSRPAN